MTYVEKQWLKENKVIRVSGPQAFPPFQYFDRDKQYVGIATDYLRHISGELGITLDIQPPTPWITILDQIRNKEIDLLTCAAFTRERAEFMLFTEPHLRFPLVIISRKNGPVIKRLKDIKGLRVAIKKKISTESQLRNTQINYTPYFIDSPSDALQAVSQGVADLCIENLGAASHIIQQQGLTNLQISAPSGFQDYALSIAVRKDWPQFVSILNKSLAVIPQKKHDEIRQKWISVRYEHGIRPMDVLKWSLVIFVSTITIISLIFMRNRQLKKEIMRRKGVESKLLESERILSTLIKNLPGLAYRCKNEFNWPMEFISEGCYSMTGYQPHEISRGSSLQYGDLIHKEDRQKVWEAVQEGVNHDKAFEVDYRIFTKSGEVRWVWERGGKVIDTETGKIFLEGFITDITDQKSLAEKLRQVHKMEAIGTLAGGIAHDFNNIIHGIRGYCEIITHDLSPDHPSQDDLQEIFDYSTRASLLVKQILAYSQHEDFEIKPIDAKSVTSNTLQMLAPTLPTSIELKSQLQDNIPYILADHTGFQQIILNLCNNAIQALEGRQGRITVTLNTTAINEETRQELSLDNPGEYVQLIVSDTGKGIDSDTMHQIFDPYFTTKDLGSGTGLGLAATHGLIKKYQGSIDVQSTPGEGTTFILLLPTTEHANLPQ